MFVASAFLSIDVSLAGRNILQIPSDQTPPIGPKFPYVPPFINPIWPPYPTTGQSTTMPKSTLPTTKQYHPNTILPALPNLSTGNANIVPKLTLP